MGKPHPMELRERVVVFVEEGNTHRSAAAHFRVSTSSSTTSRPVLFPPSPRAMAVASWVLTTAAAPCRAERSDAGRSGAGAPGLRVAVSSIGYWRAIKKTLRAAGRPEVARERALWINRRQMVDFLRLAFRRDIPEDQHDQEDRLGAARGTPDRPRASWPLEHANISPRCATTGLTRPGSSRAPWIVRCSTSTLPACAHAAQGRCRHS